MITSQDAEQRKHRILDAAYSLFTKRGIDKVGYGAVAELSGISESSIYRYFPRKSYLLLETYKYLWRDIQTHLKQATVETEEYQAACGLQQIELLFAAYESVYTEHGGHLKFALECKLYWGHQAVLIPQSEYDSIITPIVQLFAAALRKGREDNSIHLPASYNATCFLMWGIFRAYMEQLIIMDGFYMGENRYRSHTQSLRETLLKALR